MSFLSSGLRLTSPCQKYRCRCAFLLLCPFFRFCSQKAGSSGFDSIRARPKVVQSLHSPALYQAAFSGRDRLAPLQIKSFRLCSTEEWQQSNPAVSSKLPEADIPRLSSVGRPRTFHLSLPITAFSRKFISSNLSVLPALRGLS